MIRFSAGIRQYGTHRALTRHAKSGTSRHVRLPLDAIIVPGTRPAAYLDHAITLAKSAGCRLLILCSQQLHRDAVEEFLAARSFGKATVIDLPENYSHELLTFSKLESIRAELPPGCALYITDLSMKRNLGLVLAKMLRWRRVLFLDDDIRDIAYPDLQVTVDMLGSFPAAGMWVTDFPDNSIVCHANRATGGSQDVFVSGATLAVDCRQEIGFFPDIYNEDWLFFFDYAASRRLANSCLKATQLSYYPFANPQRAAWQEFGDVLAEGLYALLHHGRNEQHATLEYWELFLEARRHFLEGVLSRAQKADHDVRDDMVASVQAAVKSLVEITPELCARYVQSWRIDLEDWKRRLNTVPKMASIEAALAELRLASATPVSDARKVMPNWATPVPEKATAGPVVIPQIDTLRQMPDPGSVLGTSTPRVAIGATDSPAVSVIGARGRHWRRWLSLSALSGGIRNDGSSVHGLAAVSGPPPQTLKSAVPEEPPGSVPRNPCGRELTPFLADIYSLHNRHSVADCYSAAYFRGDG